METSKTSATEQSSPRRKRLLAGLVGAVVLVGAISIWIGAAGDGDALTDDAPTAVVTRGELVFSVTEKGDIEAQNKTIIANNLPWNVVIAQRVEEGCQVQTGDLIIEFECKELLDAIDRAKLDVTAAQNEYQQAKEDISLSAKECRHKISKAEATLENATNNLRKFEQHEQTQQLQEAQGELALARQDLELAEGKLKFMEKVNAAPGLTDTYSASTIKAERLRVDRLKLSVATSLAQVEKLTKYEHPRELRRLQLEVTDAELELERAQLEAKAQARLVTVNEAAKKSRLEMQTRKLEDLLDQERKLTQTAEAPGIIIYDSGRWWDAPDLSIGAMVRSRQRLMQIPDMSSLRVTSRVFEGVSEKVRLGMPATVRLDSRPGDVFTGKVCKIAQIASSQDRRNNPNVKVFPIEIELDRIPDDLKPGSTAQVELVLARLQNVLIVPIAAVITEQELTYCWRLVKGAPVRTFVQIGLVSETHVEILDGLTEGDMVLLAPPDDAEPAPAEQAKPEKTPPARPDAPKAEQPQAGSVAQDRPRPAKADAPREGRGMKEGRPQRPSGAEKRRPRQQANAQSTQRP